MERGGDSGDWRGWLLGLVFGVKVLRWTAGFAADAGPLVVLRAEPFPATV